MFHVPLCSKEKLFCLQSTRPQITSLSLLSLEPLSALSLKRPKLLGIGSTIKLIVSHSGHSHTQYCLVSSSFMALQEDGWPLGLRPVNARIGLVRNRDFNGSISFTTLLTGSPTSLTDSTSDLDKESTGSFFHDKSITLGNLIGVSSIIELSQRSSTRRRTSETLRDQKNYKSKTWLFSLCSKLSTDAVNTSNTPSLGHFLKAERRAANFHRRNSPLLYGLDDFSPVLPPIIRS